MYAPLPIQGFGRRQGASWPPGPRCQADVSDVASDLLDRITDSLSEITGPTLSKLKLTQDVLALKRSLTQNGDSLCAIPSHGSQTGLVGDVVYSTNLLARPGRSIHNVRRLLELGLRCHARIGHALNNAADSRGCQRQPWRVDGHSRLRRG